MSIPLNTNKALNLAEARRVLTLEAQGLQALAASLDTSFEKAIQVLSATKGRVVVTGMGKSGIVARKIAATLSSTGTPAMFVHPAEASHGDLGMISDQDTLIVLSTSGETLELSDMIAHAHRIALPLIAITQKPLSTLAETAVVALILPTVEEACPLGLAPTTSTTMMMALGDALATALLNHRGFSSEDFGRLHPGGKLGQKLMRIAQLMHDGDAVPLVSETTLLQEGLLIMTSKGFGCLGVVDEKGGLCGIITDGDLRRHMAPDLLSKAARDIMTPHPLTIQASALVQDALALMNTRNITTLFVANEEELAPIGIVHIHDFLRARIA